MNVLAPDGSGWTSLGAAWNRVNTSEFAGTSRLPLDTPGVDFVTLDSSAISEKKPAPHGGPFVFGYLLSLKQQFEMDEHELQQRAQQAFQQATGSQRDVARALDVNRSSVSRALRNAGLKHAAVQARIVSLLEGVPVQRRSTYRGADVEHEWIVGP